MTQEPQATSFEDIDWSQLHKEARKKKAWPSKKKGDWSQKAPAFAKGARDSAYIDFFLAGIEQELDKNTSVLDIGAGPGTLSIPIAQKVQAVTALDYSPGMLDELRAEANRQEVVNIVPKLLAWEDDWAGAGIEMHDICIASRSLGVKDLAMALKKINNFARKKVFITDRINPTPFDAAAFHAIGRKFNAGPDYIFSINMLYSFGIVPEMKIIEFEKDKNYESFDAAVASYQWMFHDELHASEQAKLRQYIEERTIYHSDKYITIRQGSPQRWALISWNKERTLEI